VLFSRARWKREVLEINEVLVRFRGRVYWSIMNAKVNNNVMCHQLMITETTLSLYTSQVIIQSIQRPIISAQDTLISVHVLHSTPSL
jgi:hypothetical protein